MASTTQIIKAFQDSRRKIRSDSNNRLHLIEVEQQIKNEIYNIITNSLYVPQFDETCAEFTLVQKKNDDGKVKFFWMNNSSILMESSITFIDPELETLFNSVRRPKPDLYNIYINVSREKPELTLKIEY